MDPYKIHTKLESIKGNSPLSISLYLAAVVGQPYNFWLISALLQKSEGTPKSAARHLKPWDLPILSSIANFHIGLSTLELLDK